MKKWWFVAFIFAFQHQANADGTSVISPFAILRVTNTWTASQTFSSITVNGLIGGTTVSFSTGAFNSISASTMTVSSGTFSSVSFSTAYFKSGVIDGLGNMGVGTTAPESKLEVSGALRISGIQSANDWIFQAESAGEPVFNAYLGTSRSFGMRSNAIFQLGPGGMVSDGQEIVISPSGATSHIRRSANTFVAFGDAGTTRGDLGLSSNRTDGATSIGMTFNQNTSMTTAGARLFEFQEAGTSVMTIDQAGNIGVGTDSPSSKLDVFNGSITIRGTDAGIRSEGLISGTTIQMSSGTFTSVSASSITIGVVTPSAPFEVVVPAGRVAGIFRAPGSGTQNLLEMRNTSDTLLANFVADGIMTTIGGIKVTGQGAFTGTGAGTEMSYDGATGNFRAYDRTLSKYLTFRFNDSLEYIGGAGPGIPYFRFYTGGGTSGRATFSDGTSTTIYINAGAVGAVAVAIGTETASSRLDIFGGSITVRGANAGFTVRGGSATIDGTFVSTTGFVMGGGTFTANFNLFGPATGGALCVNANNMISKCTSAIDASGNCTCP